MRINNATLRRIIKEELNNVFMEMNAPTPDTAELGEFMQTQQEGVMAGAMFLSSMYGQVADNDPNIQSADDIQGITMKIDGDDINVSNQAMKVTAEFLKNKAESDSEDAQLAADGLEALYGLAEEPMKVIRSFGTADKDGDGYLNSEVTGGFSLGSNSEGGVYATQLLKLVVDKLGQADAPASDSPETTVRSGSSTNADAKVGMLEIQPDKEAAKEEAKNLLQRIEANDAGVKHSGDTVERLKAIANQ